jgi:hypothetical protein
MDAMHDYVLRMSKADALFEPISRIMFSSRS